jgi:hypothetical protein
MHIHEDNLSHEFIEDASISTLQDLASGILDEMSKVLKREPLDLVRIDQLLEPLRRCCSYVSTRVGSRSDENFSVGLALQKRCSRVMNEVLQVVDSDRAALV